MAASGPRKQPGLKAQHVTGAGHPGSFAACILKGRRSVPSTLICEPGHCRNDVEADIGTVDSITLLLQCLMLPLAAAPHAVLLHLIGGTDAPMALLWDAFATTVLPFANHLAEFDFTLVRRGFQPCPGR